MEIIAQFIITFMLSYIAAYSTKRWLVVGMTVFGVIAIPILAILFLAGNDHAAWATIGAGLSVLLTGIINLISTSFSHLPAMTLGTCLGLIVGSGIFRNV